MKNTLIVLLVVLMIALIAWGITEIGQQMNIDNNLDNNNNGSDNSTVDNNNTDNQNTDVNDDTTDDSDTDDTDKDDEVIDDDKTDDEIVDEDDDKDNISEIDFQSFPNDELSWWYIKKAGEEALVTDEIEGYLDMYNGIYKGNTSQKVVYLTFDEGYEYGFTPLILDTLKDNNVKAAFFITSYFLKEHEDYVRRMVEEGHIVGNHSVNHPNFVKLETFEAIKEEVMPLNEKVFELFGYEMTYFRNPSGLYSQRSMKVLQELGFKSVFWSFAYRDWETDNQKGADYAYDQIMPYMTNGRLLLLHAVSEDNALVLDRLIKDLKEQGFRFGTLDEIE